MLVRIIVMAAAVLAATVPMPSGLVEAYFSRDLYLSIQARVTPATNGVPVALLDVAVTLLVVFVLVAFARRVRQTGMVRALVRSTVSVATLGAVIYLLFLAMWGLNYRRQPLERKLAFDQQRVTAAAARSLGEHAARVMNAAHTAAHATVQEGPSLEAAFGAAQQMLGHSRLAVPGVPKRSTLEAYFAAAAIDGMTDPFFLEVILNPEVLPFERPFVLAHEWAHLAGYAHEAEANLLAWLTCMQGNALARYSGWLAIFEHVIESSPRAERHAFMALLDPGPRQDLASVAGRYERSSRAVRTAARDVYDSYLRANRVQEGIASYTGVVRLLLGTGLHELAPGQPLLFRPAN
jgi:Protein of unknown function (DUF3810)